MNTDNSKKNTGQNPQNLKPVPATPPETDEAAKKSWFGRVSNKFSDALQTSRGDVKRDDLAEPAVPATPPRRERPPLEEEAPRNQKTQPPAPTSPMSPAAPIGKKMVVPEGTTIGGSIRAANVETEIAGRIEGDISVEGRLFLGPTAVVTGNVRAMSCRIEGLVEGKMQCSQEIELARTGRLNSDAAAGKLITVAGQIHGTLQSAAVRLVANGRIEGDVQARQLYIEEGAIFNGRCSMKAPAQRN